MIDIKTFADFVAHLSSLLSKAASFQITFDVLVIIWIVRLDFRIIKLEKGVKGLYVALKVLTSFVSKKE